MIAQDLFFKIYCLFRSYTCMASQDFFSFPVLVNFLTTGTKKITTQAA